MLEPIGFHGIYDPAPAIEHAIKNWSKRQDVTQKDWITAIRAESDQRQNDALCGLYNALHYYEQENESNLARLKEKNQMSGREQEQISKMEKKASNWKFATWAVTILSVAAFCIMFNVMSEKLEEAKSQNTAPRLVLPPSS
jgi:hypothetical protein